MLSLGWQSRDIQIYERIIKTWWGIGYNLKSLKGWEREKKGIWQTFYLDSDHGKITFWERSWNKARINAFIDSFSFCPFAKNCISHLSVLCSKGRMCIGANNLGPDWHKPAVPLNVRPNFITEGESVISITVLNGSEGNYIFYSLEILIIKDESKNMYQQWIS